MSKVNVTLFHADWCGHCQSFKPTWKKLVSHYHNSNVNLKSVESNDPSYNKLAHINGEGVRGYPTIKLEYNGVEKEYSGERTEKALISAISELSQSGGAKKKKYRVIKKKSKSKKKSKRKSKSKQKGGSKTIDYENMSEREIKDLLIHKISKYQYKYDKLMKKMNGGDN
jgi:thiol-disulfide isomerase/thioredoxin